MSVKASKWCMHLACSSSGYRRLLGWERSRKSQANQGRSGGQSTSPGFRRGCTPRQYRFIHKSNLSAVIWLWTKTFSTATCKPRAASAFQNINEHSTCTLMQSTYSIGFPDLQLRVTNQNCQSLTFSWTALTTSERNAMLCKAKGAIRWIILARGSETPQKMVKKAGKILLNLAAGVEAMPHRRGEQLQTR